MKEQELIDKLKTFSGLVDVLTHIAQRLTDLEKQVEEHRKRWLE